MLVLLAFLSFTTALSTFESKCTLPNTTTAYVSSPDTRGTLDIVWSSLATIIACVYTVLHLNVPEQRRGRDPGWRGNICWWWKGIRSGLGWAIVTTLIPELALLKASMDLSDARSYLKRLQKLAPNTKWTLEHMLYAQMGGFVAIDEDVYWYFTPTEVVTLLEQRRDLAESPPISSAGLKDKSKSDSLGRSIAIFQICYFVVSTIVRAARHLPVSQLELAACAYVPYAILLYIVTFSKPKGAQHTTTLLVGRLPEGIAELPISNSSVLIGTAGFLGPLLRLPARRPGCFIPNDWLHDDPAKKPRAKGPYIIGLFALPLPFGAIHAAAWDFSFPNAVDLTLWRVSSIALLAIFPLLFMMLVVVVLLDYIFDISNAFADILRMGAAILYCMCRIILLVETFRTLAYLPTNSYVATWTASIPHIG